MNIFTKDSETLKLLIKTRYNSLLELAKTLQIAPSTLSRKLQNPSRAFLIELKNAGIPIPDDLINPSPAKIPLHIYEAGDIQLRISDLQTRVDELTEENKNLKIENYDLRRELEKERSKNAK